jgi:rare lipoprotein A (peptidoglycan hydrolase)
MRRLAACVTIALLAAVATPATAEAEPSLGELRAQRSVLIRRIAGLTDEATRLQARAGAARQRRLAAEIVAEEARRHLARYAVDAFIAGGIELQTDQLRRNVYAGAASRVDQILFTNLDRARAAADAEDQAATAALANAERVTAELRFARDQLEHTIVERVRAERASAEARRLATAAARPTTRPRFGRATRSQAELFATYPFGPATRVPDGLTATGSVVTGKASWYGPGFDGRPTASGAIFDQEGWTVASRDLPLGTILYISHGGRSVLALVNDRGPFVAGRVLDLSHGVANALGTVQAGVATVTAVVLAPASA